MLRQSYLFRASSVGDMSLMMSVRLLGPRGVLGSRGLIGSRGSRGSRGSLGSPGPGSAGPPQDLPIQTSGSISPSMPLTPPILMSASAGVPSKDPLFSVLKTPFSPNNDVLLLSVTSSFKALAL